ncbi:ATP-binding protein [Geobacter sp.]|uniref:hybrid sensor histidine kinase/response regulator n=1 Tax=Geobacter sp. TaxID=46610 RepID=UPI00262B5427|nr:ATP-binding protein [Geobacter sp.]
METKKLSLLLVEDSAEDALLLLRDLRKGGYDVEYERVETMPAMEQALASREWDLVISDYRMPNFSAPAALETLKRSGLDLPFIIVSGKIGEEMLVDAMRSGAHDYLMKGNLSRLIPAVERELRESAERRTRRRAELAIRQGKIEWEAAFDAVSDLVVLTDPKGTIIRCNNKLIEYFRTTYNRVIGTDITELFYGEREAEGSIFRLCSELKPDQEDVRFPVLKGWYNAACYPMHPTESKHGFVYVIKDITKRKRMEEEKKLTDRELLTLYAIAFRLNSRRGSKRIMVDLLSQLHHMLQIDFSGIHLLERGTLALTAWLGLSREFAAAFRTLRRDAGWVREVLGGKSVKSDEIAGHFSAAATAAAEAMGMGAWCALPLKIGSGVIGVLFVSHRSVRNYTDREVFLLSSIANQMAVLIENHTLYDRMKVKNEELQRSKRELKEHLEEVKRANIELGRLNQAKNSFIGMASHELKTPLTSIMGGLQFLLHYSDISMTPEQKEMMESVYEGVTQLKGIVDDLLSISRIEAKGFVLQKRPVNLTSLCEEVRHTLLLPLSERDIAVSITADACSIPADEGFCRLVVRNLLENAIKFTPDGGRIEISGRPVIRDELLGRREFLRCFYREFPENVEKVGEFYRLDVADTGVGIPEEERVRIFEKFYGIGDIAYHSSGKTGYMSKGSGLGLSIVKGIMDAHGGMVWVEPGAGGAGSVFSLLFPMT